MQQNLRDSYTPFQATKIYLSPAKQKRTSRKKVFLLLTSLHSNDLKHIGLKIILQFSSETWLQDLKGDRNKRAKMSASLSKRCINPLHSEFSLELGWNLSVEGPVQQKSSSSLHVGGLEAGFPKAAQCVRSED